MARTIVNSVLRTRWGKDLACWREATTVRRFFHMQVIADLEQMPGRPARPVGGQARETKQDGTSLRSDPGIGNFHPSAPYGVLRILIVGVLTIMLSARRPFEHAPTKLRRNPDIPLPLRSTLADGPEHFARNPELRPALRGHPSSQDATPTASQHHGGSCRLARSTAARLKGWPIPS